jgi:uncharacterized protein YjiS (DUF1127 family)
MAHIAEATYTETRFLTRLRDAVAGLLAARPKTATRDYTEISGLSARQLKDIGVNRYDAPEHVRERISFL